MLELSLASFVDVADKIGDPQLEPTLLELASLVRSAINNAKFVTPTSKVRANLTSLKKEIRRFESKLKAAEAALLDYPPDYGERVVAVQRALAGLGEVCDRGLAEVPKRGAAKIPGRLVCAIIVLEAWTKVHGRQPGANSPRLQQCCDEYWQACGHKSLGSPGNWRRLLLAAIKNRSGTRSVIQREITQSWP